jgi:hypothetical protein
LNISEIDQLIDSLSGIDKNKLIAKKFQELPMKTRYEIFQKEMGDSGLMVVSGTNSAIDITQLLRNSHDYDIAAVLDLLVANYRTRAGTSPHRCPNCGQPPGNSGNIKT